MEKSPHSSLQNFDAQRTEILKNRLFKTLNTTLTVIPSQNHCEYHALMKPLRSISGSMLVSSVQTQQSSIPINNLSSHSIAPVKIHATNAPYPLQLSTVHVPVQIPGSASNINVPVQISMPSNVPLQLAAPTVSLPIQVSATTTVPVQLPAGATINVPLQLPPVSQSIQITTSGLTSMPILHSSQPFNNSIFHVHMGSNTITQHSNAINTMDSNNELTLSTSTAIQQHNATGTVQVKMSNANGAAVQVGTNPAVMQIPNSVNNPIQLQLPSTGSTGSLHLRGPPRTMPHMMYIQTPTGLKPVTNSEVMSQASTSGTSSQIIVRRPVTNTPGVQLISNINKTNIAPKVSLQNKSILANGSQPIVIQKPKPNVSIVSNAGKPGLAYLGTIKKGVSKLPENQSILIPNNQLNPNVSASGNQKLFITPMSIPKMPNTKFILPMPLPNNRPVGGLCQSQGSIINLQIANGQIQNDAQGNITVMRESAALETKEMPPLQPLIKSIPVNNSKDNNSATPPNCRQETQPIAINLPGSRAESTGEQEYTLSIPETNASMNDDIYTVSIADSEGGHSNEKSFTLAIPEKGKSLLNKNIIEKDAAPSMTLNAAAISKRSLSVNNDVKVVNSDLKRRISLSTDNSSNKKVFLRIRMHKVNEKNGDGNPIRDTADDKSSPPSLFCDEKLDKDLESKINLVDSDQDDVNDSKKMNAISSNYRQSRDYMTAEESVVRKKRNSSEVTLEEDPPGLMWNNGVALLQGSHLQFQTNEFGLIDIIDNNEQDSVLPTAKYQTPLKQRLEKNGREKKPTSPEDLYRCDGCGCHGMAADFITPNFCSSTCQSDVHKINQKKKDREQRSEIMKKRNKLKKMLIKKPVSEIDSLYDKDEKFIFKQYDSLPNDRRLSTEDVIENEKYPWMCGKNGFSWMRYLVYCKAKSPPLKLFKDPFPYNKNGFKMGMRMEAIDPAHPSMFCVVSVAEIQGYRMRLHFDDYPEVYDYWVNADSIDIFPPGWCEKNGRTLMPPANCDSSTFLWPLYLKQMKAVAAPKHLFPHLCNTMIKPNGFRIGMKLEAEDRKNKLVCVATVADMLDNRMLINFDSWDEMYDYWVDPTSPFIHPVGWAEENHMSLTPPNFFKDPDSFSWEMYLSETSSTAAPARAFKTRAPQGYKPGMKCEVVDKRVPFLIRVATISDVKGYQVRVSFDGWPDELSYWADDDSTEIHPVGWCLKTGHPLEPPLTEEEANMCGPCGVLGCRGLGSLHGGAHKSHAAASACPYRIHSESHPPRLPLQVADHALPRSCRVFNRVKPPPSSSTPTSDVSKEKLSRGRPTKHKRIEDIKSEPLSDEESASGSGGKRWCTAEVAARVNRDYPTRGCLGRVLPVLTSLDLPHEPRDWAKSDVARVARCVAGEEAAVAVCTAQLGGRELLMLSREELVACLQLRLGPAIKLYAAISHLRRQHT